MLAKMLLKITLVIGCLFSILAAPVEVKTVFGPLLLEPQLLKIYNLQHMQRLKGVDQSGATAYWSGVAKFGKLPKISRLEHSVDVLWLVKNYGGDLKEQIAALVHDISYTVFSQVADRIFGVKNYQDTIHEWFLEQTGIANLISNLDLVEKDILPENPEFKRLKQPLPDLCADQIAADLRAALLLKIINTKGIKAIVDKLRFENGKWYFTSRKAAKKFAIIALILAEHFWGSVDNAVICHLTGLILKRAFSLKRITKMDMNFGTDKQILDKLNACDDQTIKRYIAKAKFVKKAYKILKDGEGTPDFVPKPKFRGVDPWVYSRHTRKFSRLSTLDSGFAKQFKRVKEFCAKGVKIQLQIN